MSMATFEKDCCVCVYHIYQRVWDAAIGENFTCRREPTNAHNTDTHLSNKCHCLLIFMDSANLENLLPLKIS